MKRTADYLAQLPDRGWGVLRAPDHVALILHFGGLIKVQLTAHRGVYHARLTGPGRAVLRSNCGQTGQRPFPDLSEKGL